MQAAVLILALQVRGAPITEVAVKSVVADSARDMARARHAQASFERSRRASLPFSSTSGGRCDVRLGRFCWWYDESMPTFPPEAEIVVRRRADLLTQLDELGARYPHDDWLAGMRVHYRVDGRRTATADSVARSCRASAWWCSALVGHAAHARGDVAGADSAFSVALSLMPADEACAWRDIAPLLSDDDRDAYTRVGCDERSDLENRYWLLSRPQLATGGRANEWFNEFNARRVLNWLGERAATPHLLTWGPDAAELVLRYGWPTAWSRVSTSSVGASEPSIVGHDPSPSFAFAPVRVRADSMVALAPEAWSLGSTRSEARYAPRLVRFVTGVAAQIARFRRGDSTLVVAAFSARHDSLRTVISALAAIGDDSLPVVGIDSGGTGRTRVSVAGQPTLAGIEITDTTTRALARTRIEFIPVADSGRLALSDLLVYRAGAEPAASLESALAQAVPGDTVSRRSAIGVFWETYGLSTDGEAVDVAVSVERVDRGWLRSTRQKLGLAAEDTPIRIRWTDARPPAGRAASHAISLDLANLDAGRYRVTLTVIPESGSPVATAREIQLLDR